MASIVGIANRALTRIGAQRIVDLEDDNPRARAVNDAWEDVRDEVFRAHPWNSLGARVQLTAEGTTPAFGYDSQFVLPADCLRVLEVVVGSDLPALPWVVEGRRLLSSEGTTIDVRYTKRETDPNVWDPLLRSALAQRLAAEIAEEITQSNTKVRAAWELYQGILTIARRADALEQSPMDVEEDDWILARA